MVSDNRSVKHQYPHGIIVQDISASPPFDYAWYRMCARFYFLSISKLYRWITRSSSFYVSLVL